MRLAALGLAVLCGACSSGPPVPLEAVPLPPTAVEGTLNGAFEARLDLASTAAHRMLRETYGPMDIRELTLDTTATWAELEAFYTDVFAGLDGFEAWDRGVVEGRRYTLAAWERRRVLETGEAIAVVFIPGRPGDPVPFLALMRAPRP